MFKKLFTVLFVLSVLLSACGKSHVATSAPVPTASAPSPTPTVTQLPHTPQWEQWSSFGFSQSSWTVDVRGENSACVMDLRTNPHACSEPIQVRPQNDLIIVRSGVYFMTLLRGETTTIDFNTGVFQFFAFDRNDIPFSTGWHAGWYLFVEETPVLITAHTDSTTDFINLADGQAYSIDQEADLFSFDPPTAGYPNFGHLQCTVGQKNPIVCAIHP